MDRVFLSCPMGPRALAELDQIIGETIVAGDSFLLSCLRPPYNTWPLSQGRRGWCLYLSFTWSLVHMAAEWVASTAKRPASQIVGSIWLET